jgi:hypothetical protein
MRMFALIREEMIVCIETTNYGLQNVREMKAAYWRTTSFDVDCMLQPRGRQIVSHQNICECDEIGRHNYTA